MAVNLKTRLSHLNLRINKSPLEALIEKLLKELAKKNIGFKPKFYLSDEWGCPHKIPVIAIPFYLADKRLTLMEKKMTGIPAENKKEVMMYLRHETGHALNYAYRFYLQSTWKKIFGLFKKKYKENYIKVPGDKRFVNYLPDYYAQKHPDEDFAETFAVWLDPRSNWQKIYAKKPAMAKLLYVDWLMEKYAGQKPHIVDGRPDRPLSKIKMTLREWYRLNSKK